MRLDMNNSALMQGQFSKTQMDKPVKNKDGTIEKKSQNNAMSSYDKMIENIKEQMKKVQENEIYDEDTKKEKLEELKSQIEDIKKAEQEAKTKKMESEVLGKPEKDKKDKSTYNENSDGDEFIISAEMQELIKKDSNIDRKEEKQSLREELKGSKKVLKSEIEADKSRGVSSEKKADELRNLNKRIKALDENELEKMTNTEEDEDSKPKSVNV